MAPGGQRSRDRASWPFVSRCAGPWRLREPRWAVLAGSFVTVVVVYGTTYSFPVFLLSLTRELGGLRGLAAAAFALHNLVVGLVATVVDPLRGRFGERRVSVAGSILLGAGLAATALARDPEALLGAFGLLAGTGAGVLGSVAQTVVLTRWFPSARGAVVGFALSGMGIGMFLFAPLAAFLMERLGWRGAFVVLGLGAVAILAPVHAMLPVTPLEAVAPAGAAPPSSLGAVLRTGRFWCFAAAFFFTPVSNMMVTTHQVAHVVEAGVEPRWAAAAFGLVGLLSGVGRTGFGALSDRWGRVPTALATYAVTGAGTVALLLVRPAGPRWPLYAFVVLFGLTLGARGPIIAALVADVYRGRTYGVVLGLVTLGNRVGSAVGPWVGGVLHDLTGSYQVAFMAALGALALAALALAAAGRPSAGPGAP